MLHRRIVFIGLLAAGLSLLLFGQIQEDRFLVSLGWASSATALILNAMMATYDEEQGNYPAPR